MDFPVWLICALISPFFWAIVHVFDSYCVNEVFDRPWIGIVTSGFTTLLVLPLFAIGLLFSEFVPVSMGALALCLICGAAFMVSQAFYFQALAISESGIVAAYWNFIPVILPFTSYFIFSEILTPWQYTGMAVLVSSSVAFCLLDGNLESRWTSFWLMFFGALLQVVYFQVQKIVFDYMPVYQAFCIIGLAMGVTGIAPLFMTRPRAVFRQNWQKIRPSLQVLAVIEVANLVAIGTSQLAVDFGRPSLVSAVEASIPAYTFSLSFFLYVITRTPGEEEAKENYPIKIALVGVMIAGVYLVS
jgi:drug/metabolite transporter (DMT)-like permease